MKGKYLILDNDIPILLSEASRHADIVYKERIISAGYFTFNKKFKCYGESTSLGIKSRKEDSDIINIFFRGN